MREKSVLVLICMLMLGTLLYAQNVQTNSAKPNLYYLVVDKSGSIADKKLVESIKKAIYNSTDTIACNTDVHVTIFSDDRYEFFKYPFDGDAKHELYKFVEENYKPEPGLGRTPLYKTAADVFRKVWKNKDKYSRIDIVFLTDGENYYPPERNIKSWNDVFSVLPDQNWIKERRDKGTWNTIWYVVEAQKLDDAARPDESTGIIVEEISRDKLQNIGQPPRAAFRLNPSTVEENKSVMFALNSTVGVTEIEWDFGDGSQVVKQTDTIPVYHKYTMAKKYMVTVTARGPAGSEKATGEVNVLRVVPLQAAFSFPSVIRVNQEIQFIDNSLGAPDEYEWDIQGDSFCKDRNPLKKFSQAGKYKVILKVTKAGKSAECTREITVLPELPNSSFDVAPRVVEMGQMINLKAKKHKDGWHHHWMIGNKHQFDGVEIKWKADILDDVQVIHSVTDVFGGKSEDFEHVFVKPQPDAIVARFTWAPSKPRVGDTIRFVDESHGAPKNWEWKIGDRPVQIQRNPTVVFDKEGDYNVTLLVKADGRAPSVSKQTITILPPIVDLIADFDVNTKSGKTPLSVQFTDKSQGKVSSWHWDFGDGATSDVKNPVHVYETVGTFTPRLTIKNSRGAEAKDSGGISLTSSAPMTPLQKALIWLGIIIVVWVLLIARIILDPILLPRKGVVLQGGTRYQIRKLASKGFFRWLFWPRNSIVIGTGNGHFDISLGDKTGKKKNLAVISRTPMTASYSVTACEDGTVSIIRKDGSDGEAQKTPIARNKSANLKDGIELEISGNRFTWIQPAKRKGSNTRK